MHSAAPQPTSFVRSCWLIIGSYVVGDARDRSRDFWSLTIADGQGQAGGKCKSYTPDSFFHRAGLDAVTFYRASDQLVTQRRGERPQAQVVNYPSTL